MYGTIDKNPSSITAYCVCSLLSYRVGHSPLGTAWPSGSLWRQRASLNNFLETVITILFCS